MKPSKPSPGSSEMAQETTSSESKSARGSPSSSGSASPNPPKTLEGELSSKIVPLPQKQLELQAQKELKKAREEKSRALEKLNEVKQANLAWRREEYCEGPARIKALEEEIEKAKESERKMLESLVSQTKQMEQTMIELEEAKLEIRNLQESIGGLENSRSSSTKNLLKLLEKPMPSAPTLSLEEVTRLENELKLAIEAEDKSKKAMDSLALALKEVTTEASVVKGKLSISQSQLERARAEADRLKSTLKAKEDKLQMVVVEAERLRVEADEAAAAWSAKEQVFISCIKVSEEEAAKVMQENRRLLESQEAAREENSKLRGIMKQALQEANVAKTGLEVTRRENSQLKCLLSEKESSLEAIKQEHEGLKVSEAEGLGSVRELESLPAHAAASTLQRSKSARLFGYGSLTRPEKMEKQGTRRNAVTKFPPEGLRNDGAYINQNGLRVPVARTGSFHAFGSVRVASSQRKDYTHGSLGCVSDMTVPSLCGLGNGKALHSDGLRHVERNQLDGTRNGSGSTTKKKRKQILQKFNELLRRQNFHNYEPVNTADALTL